MAVNKLSASEIISLRDKLTKALAEKKLSDAHAILAQLKQGVVPTEELIRQTKIGQTIGKLRNNEDKATSQAAKALVAGWKTEVDKQRASSVKKKDSAAGTPNRGSATSSPALGSAGTTPVSSSAKAPLPKGTTSVAKLDFEVLRDKTRNACLRVIFTALELDAVLDASVLYERAVAVEKAVFTSAGKGEVTTEYRNKIRSLSLNLKDKKNPKLRARVADGSLQPDVLVTLSPDDLASEERRAEREALQVQNLFMSKAAEDQQAETDAFECGRCKQRKTRYYQKQTRSADEPMTTFVTCTNCNNKWKFC